LIYGFFGSIPGCPHQRGKQALRGNGKTLSMTAIGYQSYLSEDKMLFSNYQTEFSRTVPTEEIGELDYSGRHQGFRNNDNGNAIIS